MGLPTRPRDLERRWNAEAGNLENELLLYDFFRREEGYLAERPLVLCRDGGLMAVFTMEGIDPEPLGDEGLDSASAAIRRALDAFNPANLDGDWRAGTWEVQNVFTRAEGRAPLLGEPSRDSAALRYLARASNLHWQGRTVFCDELLWTVKFLPRFRERNVLGWPIWRLRAPDAEAVLRLSDLRAQARMVRRVLRVFEENLLAFATRRPKMGFGLRWLCEAECHRALWRQVNRRWDEPTPLRADLPLAVQVAVSERDDSAEQYRINGQLARVLTWKIPPGSSIAYLFARLQNELRFPFTICQTFRALDWARLRPRIGRQGNFAAALAGRHRPSALYHAEAQDLLGRVGSENACPFNWYFNAVIQAPTLAELEDRAAKLGSQMKLIKGGDAMEERANRLLGELSSLPGNGQYGLRFNLVTSRNVGDLAMVYRLSAGDPQPSMLFGDRQGGVFAYSLFSRREPSWNKAVLGLPGSGKSMLLNAFLLGNAMFPSQGYVLDKGNSFGPIFELLSADMPEHVAVMRLRGGEFRFNPLPLGWALGERERQQAAGSYRMALEGGGELGCPVEEAEVFFEAWLDGLIGQSSPLSPTDKNRLDRALKGSSGQGGFFRDFENQCAAFRRAARLRGDMPPPRPLSALLTHLRNEAPELVPAVELWTRPPRDRFFDSGTDSVATARYIYFELTGLEDDPLLAVPFVLALMGTIWKRIQNPAAIKERKAVIVDEAWSFLAHPAFFRIVEDMFRTIRKFNGFVTLSTQSPKDVGEGAARKLLQSMSEVWLYKGFSEPSFMEEDLHLTPHHVRLHQSLREDDRRREVFYCSGRGLNRVLSVEIPPALYWFATTDAEDKHWRAAFCRRFGLVEGIRHLVAACDGKTIAGGELRGKRVAAYAETLGVRP
jgi:hypothetical protein